jgi:uncharacterized membrane protein YcaP (DUF421 family)
MFAAFALDEVFKFTMSPWQILLRGSLMYWFLFLVFRFVLRRDIGSMGITDFLFVVLLGDAAQNGMIGDATSTSDAVVLIATLVFWNGLLDVLSWRFRAVERLVSTGKLALVRDGRMLRRNMRREFISLEELESKLREHGLEHVEDVKAMFLEGNGEISVIPRQKAAAAK